MIFEQKEEMESKKRKSKKKKKSKSKYPQDEYINDSDEVVSEEEESEEEVEESIEIIQKPRIMRPRPIPQPPPYDQAADEEKLRNLKLQRGHINNKIFVGALEGVAGMGNWLINKANARRDKAMIDSN